MSKPENNYNIKQAELLQSVEHDPNRISFAKDTIINIVQSWFASGAVIHFPKGGTIRATDVNETVLIPKDDGSIIGNLTFDESNTLDKN